MSNLDKLPKGTKATFSKIKSWGGDKNSAITHDGLKVERQELIYAEGYGMVKPIPYELHFIYEDKSQKRGRWAFMCTCGSLAGIISYKEMAKMMTVRGTETGFVLACIAHTTSKQEMGIGRNNTSGYKGVYWHKRLKKWYVGIRNNGKLLHLGYFSNPEDAAKVYDHAAVEIHKEFAVLNF